MATSLGCKVSAISAFCRPTTQTPSITNYLVAIIHTKPIAILVPKLVSMATTLTHLISAMSSLDSLTPKTHPIESNSMSLAIIQPKLFQIESQKFVAMATSLSTCGPPSNMWFLGPIRAHNQTASRSVQPFLQGSLVWQTNTQTDRPYYLLGNNRPNLYT